MTVEQLQVVISAKTDPIQKKLKELDKTLDKLEKTTETTTKKMTKSFNKSAFSIDKMKLALIGVGIAAAKAGKAIFNLGSDAATVDNQVVALSKTMGGSSGDFMKWAQDVAVDFGISERAAASFGNQFSSIIARTEKDGAAVAELSQEYLKMGAIIAANTHFEMDDVMGRIRSGLSGRNEAIEDLGIEVKPGVIKGTEAYAAAVRDGGVAWEQMTDAQQASVRTQAILEQAQKRYGTELQGTAGKLIVLRAAIDNMKLAWGRAFAPIVDFVIPVIQRLVGWLTIAATYVRAFLGLFFKVEGSMASANKQAAGFANSMSDAATGSGNVGSGLDKANKAAKKLQRTLFGFDVIHNIDEPQDSPASGSGGGGIGGIETPEIEFDISDDGSAAFDEMNKKIEDLQAKMKEAWDSWGKYAAAAAVVVAGVMSIPALTGGLSAIAGWIAGLAASGGKLGAVFTAVWGVIEGLGGTIITKLGLGAAVDGIGAAMVGLGAITAVVAAVAGAIVQLWKTNEDFRNKMTEAWEAIKETIMVAWNNFIKPVFNAITDVAMMIIDKAIMPLWNSWVKLVEYVSMAMADLIIAIQPVYQMIANWLGTILPPIIRTLGEIFSTVFGIVSAVVGKAFEIIGAVIAWGIDLLSGLIKFLTAVFTGNWEGAWGAVLDIVDNTKKMIQRIWNAIKEFFSNILGMIKNTIVNVWTNIGEYLGHAMNFIKNVFGVAWEAIRRVISTVLDGIATFIRFAWEGIKAFFVGYFNALVAFYTTIWNGIKVVIEVAMKAIRVVIETIWNVIKAVISTTLNAIKVIVETAWNIIKTVITTVVNTIKTVITTVWEAIKVAIETVLNVIRTIITTIWEWIKDYFIRLFEIYKAMFTTVFNAIRTIIETVMNSIRTIIETIWNVIKTVFSTGLDFIKTIFTTGFNAVKSVVSTVMNSVKTTVTTVIDTVRGVFQGITNFIKGAFTGDWRKAWDGVISIFRNLFGLVPNIFKTAWDTVMKLFSSGGTIFKGFATSVADIFKKLVNSLIKGINTVIGAPFRALNTALSRFRGISILGMKPFNWLPSIGIPTIPQFAQGGFPEDGLFFANSRELVGKFSNGKTAVANNDQIISGVSTGVANAVRGVLGEGMKSDQPINLTVQIGSNTIAKEVINAIDEYTMRTGMTFKTI